MEGKEGNGGGIEKRYIEEIEKEEGRSRKGEESRGRRGEEREGERIRNRARQLYKNISVLFLLPVKDGKLSTGVIAIFNASCYG